MRKEGGRGRRKERRIKGRREGGRDRREGGRWEREREGGMAKSGCCKCQIYLHCEQTPPCPHSITTTSQGVLTAVPTAVIIAQVH